MGKVEILNDCRKRMEKSISKLDHDLNGLRTGRASPSFLDSIRVEVYGDKMPINQLGTVSVPEPRMITVQVWDKGQIKAVEKAIANANLGVNPVTDGQLVRVPIPQLSEERRIELAKLANEFGEQAKISVRNIRRDAMDEVKSLEKAKEFSEDESKAVGVDVQKVTDEFIAKVDEDVKKKQEEIKTV